MSNRIELTDEQLEAIAERAAERALEKVYEEVGRSAVRLAIWAIGAGVAVFLAWLGLTGKLK